MQNSDGKGVRFKNKEYKLDREDDEDHLTTRMTNWNIIFDIIESPPCQNIAFSLFNLYDDHHMIT